MDVLRFYRSAPDSWMKRLTWKKQRSGGWLAGCGHCWISWWMGRQVGNLFDDPLGLWLWWVFLQVNLWWIHLLLSRHSVQEASLGWPGRTQWWAQLQFSVQDMFPNRSGYLRLWSVSELLFNWAMSNSLTRWRWLLVSVADTIDYQLAAGFAGHNCSENYLRIQVFPTSGLLK